MLRVLRVIIIMAFLASVSYFFSQQLAVTHHTIESTKIPSSFDGFKIVQLTDLHSKSYGEHNARLIKKIHKENPDIIVMTGDMVSTLDADHAVFFELAEKLAQSYETYYVLGNHEQAIPDESRWAFLKQLRATGVKVLNNETAVLERGGEQIDLAGMWFNLRFYKDTTADDADDYYFGVKDIEQVMKKPNAEKFTLLLTHNPVYFETYAQWGYDLTLAGHMHGGMIRIPFVGGLVSPEREWLPQYDAGMFNENDKQMYVSRGLGSGTLKMRVFNMPEIASFTLKHK